MSGMDDEYHSPDLLDTCPIEYITESHGYVAERKRKVKKAKSKGRSEEAVVQDWLVTIKIATDADSPFAGMVDLTPIFKLPIPTQKKIHDALTQEQRDQMKKLYGPRNGGAE